VNVIIQKTPTLSCSSLAVGYKNSPVLSNINLDFSSGRFTTLLGPNGAGKTTLLRTLSRHLPPISGTISVESKNIYEMNISELARTMAVVLTDKVSPPLFSSFQFVALGRYPHTSFLGRLSTRDRQVITDSLRSVHAQDLTFRDFASLSDGERQKVLVARALAQEPRILLLDEPTAHLDLKHRIEVMSILRNLCREKGITVIASLHDVDIAARVSDRVILVKNGGITSCGYPEEVLTGKAVAELYDFDSASYNMRLGTIELRGAGKKQGRIFVVAGMGSGATIYRMLAKRGYGISTGVLHTNDLDYYVAGSLGAHCTCQPPADTLKYDRLDQALTELERCDMVIDAGFDLDGPYGNNLELLKKAAACGKTIFSLRTREVDLPGYSPVQKMVTFANPGRLLDAMEDTL
jgi:iron complex transport system ATP-binding protein